MSRKKNRKNGFLFIGIFAGLILAGSAILLKSLVPYCANSISCKQSLSEKVENDSTGVFDGQKVEAPNVDLSESESETKVLGEVAMTGEKHIYIDLASQTLTAYQGDSVYLEAKVSTGKWFPTPTGEFQIWEKVRATRMTGGQGADYYDLPNVPYVMFFAGSGISQGRGFGLHGAYWHNNFGHPMSHGCVNMRTIDAQKLYSWAEVGTKITIYGQAPL